MHILITTFLFILSFNICFADSTPSSSSAMSTTASTVQPTQPPTTSQLPIHNLPSDNLKNPLPDLGTCSEYTDYYIYQCQPFKCSFGLAKHPGVYREMSTLGFQNGECIHKISLQVRHENFRQADINISCKLSLEGRTEMANLFTRYKKGDLTAYTNRSLGPKLNKECK